MIAFAAEDSNNHSPKPTPLYAALAAASEANAWCIINGYAVVKAIASAHEDYATATQEAALVDLGSMARYSISGPDAALAIGRLTTLQCKRIAIGESDAGLMLNDVGGVIDLCDVSRLSDDMFILVTPMAHGRWISLGMRGFDVHVADISDDVGAIGLIGPNAEAAFTKTIGRKLSQAPGVSKIVRGVETAFRKIRIGDVGGYELVFPKDEALTIWERFVRRAGAVAIGLEAMELLRIEAGLPRTGVDFECANRAGHAYRYPSALGLAHLAPLDRKGFNGRSNLRDADISDHRLVTLAIDADGIAAGAQVRSGSTVLGHITSSAWSPSQKRVIAFSELDGKALGRAKELEVVAADGASFDARHFSTNESRRERKFYAR